VDYFVAVAIVQADYFVAALTLAAAIAQGDFHFL